MVSVEPSRLFAAQFLVDRIALNFLSCRVSHFVSLGCELHALFEMSCYAGLTIL